MVYSLKRPGLALPENRCPEGHPCEREDAFCPLCGRKTKNAELGLLRSPEEYLSSRREEAALLTPAEYAAISGPEC